MPGILILSRMDDTMWVVYWSHAVSMCRLNKYCHTAMLSGLVVSLIPVPAGMGLFYFSVG